MKLPELIKTYKGIGFYLIVPIDYFQTNNGLTISTLDRYVRQGEDTWTFQHREVSTWESHPTEEEYSACPRCSLHPRRKYGEDIPDKIISYTELNETVDVKEPDE